ncbi:hypothetical protein [Planomonospora sp. ID82291]|uniref:hypothetical protein n=1 Tax=Planomonospora sp. ID82291 TaxID=2738136 RepID=UPI001E454DF1|nr:hypothetical protein [Planomonospora sp. ID82291]
MNNDLPEDPQRQLLRTRLESIITRATRSTSWQDATHSLRGLVNREGFVPIRTRLTSDDLDFLEGARQELLDFAELGIRLLDLHQPRDAGGITSDAANPILRCRSCMWRWPCPTFRAMSESFGALRDPFSRVPADPAPGGGPVSDDVQVTLMVPAQPEGQAAALTGAPRRVVGDLPV